MKRIKLIFLSTLLILSTIFLCACFPDFSTTNNDKKLLSRPATYSDVSVTQNQDFSLSNKFQLIPNTDISNLQITINFKDSNKKDIVSKTKTIGNVTKGKEYTFSFSITEFSLVESFKIAYWNYEVTGGTISYFA